MSTSIGTVIAAGEAIPEDVTEFRDVGGSIWKLEEPNGWYCSPVWGDRPPTSLAGYTTLPSMLAKQWGPLTVTAVRPQPAAEPESHTPLTFITCGACGQTSMTSHYCGEEDVAKPADESVDLLDLVRQYASQRYRHGLDVGGALPDTQGHEAAAAALFARIEAEVNRLRSEKDRAFDEVNAITALLNEAEVASASPSGRVTFAIDSMRRGWATATENLARLDTVKADREAIKGSLDILKGRVREVREALGVQYTEEMVAEVERLKAAAAPDSADPLVLSLPSVPDGATALIASNGVRWIPGEDGVWRRENMPDVEFYLGQLLDSVQSVSVVMREPRTWPKLDGDFEVKSFTGKSGTRYVRSTLTDSYAAYVAAHNVGAERELLLSATRSHWQEIDGPLVEVFDEDGTRA